MALPNYSLVTRTQVANAALKDGRVKPKDLYARFRRGRSADRRLPPHGAQA